jgi:ribosome recycling factor
MAKTADTYKEAKVFQYPGMVTRVHIPDLTDEERNRRIKQIHRAAESLLQAQIKIRRLGA